MALLDHPYSTRLLCKQEKRKEKMSLRAKSTRVDEQAAPITYDKMVIHVGIILANGRKNNFYG